MISAHDERTRSKSGLPGWQGQELLEGLVERAEAEADLPSVGLSSGEERRMPEADAYAGLGAYDGLRARCGVRGREGRRR